MVEFGGGRQAVETERKLAEKGRRIEKQWFRLTRVEREVWNGSKCRSSTVRENHEIEAERKKAHQEIARTALFNLPTTSPSNISRASSLCPTSSKASVASWPPTSSKTSSPPLHPQSLTLARITLCAIQHRR